MTNVNQIIKLKEITMSGYKVITGLQKCISKKKLNYLLVNQLEDKKYVICNLKILY